MSPEHFGVVMVQRRSCGNNAGNNAGNIEPDDMPPSASHLAPPTSQWKGLCHRAVTRLGTPAEHL